MPEEAPVTTAVLVSDGGGRGIGRSYVRTRFALGQGMLGMTFRVRIWIDMTAPAHPVVFRPLIPWFQGQGHEVHVTARDYAETLGLLERFGIPYEAIGRHGGASRVRKLAALVGRTPRMRGFG